MMKAVAKVRRDGVVTEVPADQIVPGVQLLIRGFAPLPSG